MMLRDLRGRLYSVSSLARSGVPGPFPINPPSTPRQLPQYPEAYCSLPMSRSALTTLTICTTLSMLDGFDVLVMAFTASGVTKEWALTASQLGILLSSALFGMAIGSLFIAPLADRYGRRPLVLTCLCVIAAGLLLSAAARSMHELAALRGLTGIGIGGMLASLNVLTSEFASDKWRSSAISLQATGYPIGATIGGAIAAVLISEHGWRSAFLFGGICSAVMIPVVVLWLRESEDFLTQRHAAGKARPVGTLRELLRPEFRTATLFLWLAFFLLMFGLYFVLSWTPRLLVTAGLSERGGITGGVLMNVGGIIGGAAFAWLAAKWSARPLTVLYMFAFAALTAIFGAVASMPMQAYVTAWVLGIFLFGAMVGLYVLAPAAYPAAVRTTGMGWALGVGRVGAILSPSVAGYLIDAGWRPAQLYFLFAIFLVAAAGATLAFRKPPSSHQENGPLSAAGPPGD